MEYRYPKRKTLFRVTTDQDGIEVVAYFVADWVQEVIEQFEGCDNNIVKLESVRAVNTIS